MYCLCTTVSLALFLHAAAATEVTEVKIFTPSSGMLYNRAPRLRVYGDGFKAMNSSDLRVKLMVAPTATHITPEYLQSNVEFTVLKASSSEGINEKGLILKLNDGYKWANLDGRRAPLSLHVDSIEWKGKPLKLTDNDGGPSTAPKIASILKFPSIKESHTPVLDSLTKVIAINGTGLVGAKTIKILFKPAMLVNIDYEIKSPFPLPYNRVLVALRPGKLWAKDEKGHLTVAAVDTGGGVANVQLDGKTPVVVADVQSGNGRSVTVLDTASTQMKYTTDPYIVVSGTGLSDKARLQFANGIKGAHQVTGAGFNYSITSAAPTSLHLSLNAEGGSRWRNKPENLPGFLTIMQVDIGDGKGFIPVGPMNAQKGRDVATIFAFPSVAEDKAKKIYRTHSHSLKITGRGFVTSRSSLGRTRFKFNPPLPADGYTVDCPDRFTCSVYLRDGVSWTANATSPSYEGPLTVTDVNTRFDEAGWVALNPPKQVATIVADVGKDRTGGVQIFPSARKIYSSANSAQVNLVGEGFTNGLKVGLSSASAKFDVRIDSSNTAVLTLKTSADKWLPAADADGSGFQRSRGELYVMWIETSGKRYDLANGEGIRVAEVLADPSISSSERLVHKKQTKLLAVDGAGFPSKVRDIKLLLRPTQDSYFEVFTTSFNSMRLRLKRDQTWLPPYMKQATRVPITVTEIDTGAGAVKYTPPITVGYIVDDIPDVTCDDSCEYAFDGVCDEAGSTYSRDWGDYFYYGMAYEDDWNASPYSYGGTARRLDGDANSGKPYDDDAHPYYSASSYGYFYNYDYSNGNAVGSCLKGTDCTDCGGVEQLLKDSGGDTSAVPTSGVTCTNTCKFARDGFCDDTRATGYCELGTDCQDCGPVGASNFTIVSDDGWFDGEYGYGYNYIDFDDDVFLDQTKGVDANRHRLEQDDISGVGTFVTLLEGIVLALGLLFTSLAVWIGYKIYSGQSANVYQALNIELTPEELEMIPQQKMGTAGA